MRVVLLGPPGSGKSTQAAKISNVYSVPSVSPGALLRDSVQKGTDIGRKAKEYLDRGDLVPNHLVDQLVFGKLSQPDCAKGFVLDGFPRTLEQARSLDEFLQHRGQHLTAVLYINVPDSVIAARLGARRVCPVCGAIYNLLYSKPRPGDICYACHTPLRYIDETTLECEACKTPFSLREDDKPELVKRRLAIQRRAIKPVLAHYQSLGLLIDIDATRSPEEIFVDIQAVLGGKRQQAGGKR